MIQRINYTIRCYYSGAIPIKAPLDLHVAGNVKSKRLEFLEASQEVASLLHYSLLLALLLAKLDPSRARQVGPLEDVSEMSSGHLEKKGCMDGQLAEVSSGIVTNGKQKT